MHGLHTFASGIPDTAQRFEQTSSNPLPKH